MQLTHWYENDIEALLSEMQTDLEQGLSSTEVKARLVANGPNLLITTKRRRWWSILADQLKGLLTLLLAAASVLSVISGDIIEGVAIAVVIVINTCIGFFSEFNAIRSIDALRKLGATLTRVRRDGALQYVSAEGLVPGDIVILEAGDVVTADMRLITMSQLECNESLLTGESAPVLKQDGRLHGLIPLHDQSNMTFKGTSVSRGSACAVVIATGMKSELGKIASLAGEAHDELSPLEKRLNNLSVQLVWVAVVVATAVASIGFASGRDALLMIKTGIALAVAAVPEGLPIVATLALARGMWRMAQRNALVERLSAVESLGAITVLFTDKTGTLTENDMTATELYLGREWQSLETEMLRNQRVPDGILERAIRVCALCSSVESPKDEESEAQGDPTELALYEAVRQAGFSANDMRAQFPKLSEEPFDPELRMMATIHESKEKSIITVKGAPESVLAHCSHSAIVGGKELLSPEQKMALEQVTEKAAARGLRILALAERDVVEHHYGPYHSLTFLGLIALQDPPRCGAKEAVEAARRAGIKVIMLTGDNPVTAATIAQEVGLTDELQTATIGSEVRTITELDECRREHLLETRVFARVDPKQKLELVALHQSAGEIVAMTGDGVNDAPALKKADVGIAMGLRGTQVAKEAADIILRDDAFASIVAAIREGRIIFSNIRKFVVYLLSCNLSEILIVAIGIGVGLPLPLLPLQILFLNIVTDVFPALALGAGEGDNGVLNRPPRDPRVGMITRRHWVAVGTYGMTITIAVLAAFLWALGRDGANGEEARTVAFLALAFAQLWHVFNMRGQETGLLINPITLNPYVWGAIVLCTALTLGVVYTPVFSIPLKLVEPDREAWAVIIIASIFPLVAGQIVKKFRSAKALIERRQGD